MKSFAVVLVVGTMILSGFFIQTEGAVTECYMCNETNLDKCGLAQSSSEMKSEKCSKSTDKTKCYEVYVVIVVLRGCTEDDSCGIPREKVSELEEWVSGNSCVTCTTDKCNDKKFSRFKLKTTIPPPETTTPNITAVSANNQSTGSVELCASISLLVIARMFYQTIL